MSKPKDGASSSAASSATAVQQPKKKKSFLQNIFSLSSLSSFAALFYVYFAFSNLLNLMYPLRNIPVDVLENTSKDRMVFPFWNWGKEDGEKNSNGRNNDAEGSGGGELGLRVYLSSEEDFTLDFFARNDEFGQISSDDVDVGGSTTKSIRHGNSFLLWSEDNALDATKAFPSRSFVLVAKEEDSSPSSSPSSDSCNEEDNNGQTCSNKEQLEAQQSFEYEKSLEYAHKWLEDSIEHEKQLQSDGGGLMAAMNSAGGGIESTSVLLTLYTSLQRNLKHLIQTVIGGGGGNTDTKKDSSKQQLSPEKELLTEEPKSIIHISARNPLWQSLMSNGTAYVHVLLVRQQQTSSSPNNHQQHQPPGQHLISTSPDPRTASIRLQQLHSQHNVLFGKVAMMKRELPLHVPSPKRLLYRDILFVLKKYLVCPIHDPDGSCTTLIPPWNVAHHQTREQDEYVLARKHKAEGVTYPYWKPEVRIHLIQDDVGYPLDYANRVGFEIIQVGGTNGGRGGRASKSPGHSSGYAYLPAVHVDEIGLTSDKYIPLNGTVSALPLRIGFHGGSMMATSGGEEDSSQQQQQEGLTPARFRLLNHLSASLESQAEMGFEQSDIDDLRRLIAETNVMLLAVTILASVFHLLFEFLTFKSDVDFWRGNTDLTGLSVRALFLDWMSQVVILFYLIEMDSSLLMTVPTGVGMLIALWKCQRGAGLKFVKSCDVKGATNGKKAWYNKVFGVSGYELCATRLRSATASLVSDEPSQASSKNKPDLAALTEEMDQLATRLLGKYFLLPLVVSFAVYSLVKEHHAGWYSWFITTASSFVYAIGFVLMTPQLFLNYKLKSVAHLPWRVLGYRFVNTFIDDLFAFIIRMPTMARMSCFRDDVVFIIYLWQRYLYPVDASRPVEGGGVGDVVDTPVDRKQGQGKKKQS